MLGGDSDRFAAILQKDEEKVDEMMENLRRESDQLLREVAKLREEE